MMKRNMINLKADTEANLEALQKQISDLQEDLEKNYVPRKEFDALVASTTEASANFLQSSTKASTSTPETEKSSKGVKNKK